MDSAIFKLLHSFVLLYPACMVLFTFSGFFESLVALMFGDRKPYEEGFLSLNPLVHINIIGLTLLFAVLFCLSAILGAHSLTSLFAWIAVFSIRYAYGIPLSHPSSICRGLIILSRIVSYCVLAVFVKYALVYIPFDLFSIPAQKSFLQLLHMVGSLALGTAIMQMMPVYPLGMGVALMYFFPHTIGEFFQKFEEYSFFIIVVFFTLMDVFFPNFFVVSIAYLDHFLSYLVF